MSQNTYQINIVENVDFKSTKKLIELYNRSLKTGEFFDIIEITIESNEKEINGEIDPIFISYLFLYLNDFSSHVKFIFSKSVNEGRLFSLKNLISQSCFFYPNLHITVIGQYYRKKDAKTIEVEYDFDEGFLKNNKLRFSKKELISKSLQNSGRYIPPIIIDSENKVSEIFDKLTTITTNKLISEYWKKIEKKTKLSPLHKFDFSPFEVYILRLLLSDDVQRKFTSKQIENRSNYAKELAKGIRELAINIVEHSKKENQEIQPGIITVRLYEKERLLNLKSEEIISFIGSSANKDFFLDVNIIDSGHYSIRQKYLENIKRNKQDFKDFQLKINFDQDIDIIEKQNFNEFYEINIDSLTDHQTNKLISRYGLQFFTHILKERFKAFIKASSLKESTVIFKNSSLVEVEIDSFEFGTFYNCIVPLNQFVSLSEIDDLNKVAESDETPTKVNAYLSAEKYSVSEYIPKYDYTNNEIINLNQLYLSDVLENIEEIDKRVLLSRIAKKFLEIPETLRANIFSVNCENIDLNASQWLRLLSFLTSYFKNLIVYNIPNEIVAEIIEIRTASYVPESTFDFWTNQSTIIFYSHKSSKNKKFRRFGATALIGSEPGEYNFINKQIWKHRYSYRNTFALNGDKLYCEKSFKIFNSPLFDENSNLKFFELVINSEIEKTKLTLFERSIQYSLNKDLIENIGQSNTNNKGYKIPKAHFKNGSNLHTEDYYYAKRMFQNSFFTTPIAFLLAKNIFYGQPSIEELTLVGYDSYSELLLNTTRYFLERFIEKNENDKRLLKNVNHSTFVNNLFTRDLKSIHKNILIIIPIASTFSTSIKVYDQIIRIHENNDGMNKNPIILEPFYNVVLVADNNFENNLEDTKHFLSSKFRWSKTTVQNEIKVQKYDSTTNLRQKYLIPIYTRWELSTECEFCFPTNFKNEKILNTTREVPITPNVNFGLPLVYNDGLKNVILDYKESLLYKNIRHNKNKFLYYIKVSKLIKNDLLKEEESRVRDFLKKLKISLQKQDLLNKKIVIVSPSNKSQSQFINLLNDHVFNFTANCVNISVDEDFINNSKVLYEDAIFGAEFILYVDDIISTAKSFEKINYLTTFIRKNFRKNGIDLIITLINRMSFDTEVYVRNQLTKKLKNNIFYASRLHNPSIQEPNNDFPVDIEQKKYINISKNSSLEPIKQIYLEKSNKLNEKEIDFKKEANPPSFANDKISQLYINDAVYSLFLAKVRKKKEIHNTNYKLSYADKNKDIIKSIFYDQEIEPLILYVNEYLVDISFDAKNLRFIIYKLLTRPPLAYYKRIKEAALNWVLNDLDEYTLKANNLKSQSDLYEFIVKNNENEYSDYDTLKFLLKRAAELGSNSIFHTTILTRIQNFLNNVHKIQSAQFLRTNVISPLKSIFNKTDYAAVQNEIISLIHNEESLKVFLNDSDSFKPNNSLKKDLGLFNPMTNKKRIDAIRGIFKNWVEIDKNLKSKKFIYKYVGFVNELIYNHETKAIKLRKEINDFEIVDDFINGNFNHLLRLLKLENTASIESYWKSFYDKYKTALEIKDNEFETKSISETIIEKIKLDAKDPKLNNIEKLILCGKRSLDELDKNSSFINFLSLKSDLINWRKRDTGLSIKIQINSILVKTSNIIGLKNDAIGGAFFSLNYKNISNKQLDIKDIYQFEQYEVNNNKTSLFITNIDSKESLTFEMFKGIEFEKLDYPLSNLEIVKKDTSIDYRSELKISKEKLINSIEIKYCELHQNNYNILLIRISNNKDYTQAVLTYYFDKGERISEDRLRLLLLLRNPLSEFINNVYKSESLEAYLEEEKNKYKLGDLSHLSKSIDDLTKDYVNDDDDILAVKIELFYKNFLLYKNNLKQITLTESSDSFKRDLMNHIKNSNLSKKTINNNITLIIKSLFKTWLDEDLIVQDINIDKLDKVDFFPDLLDEILTECLYNINKYSLPIRKLKYFKSKLIIHIHYEDDILIIKNNNINNLKNLNVNKVNLDIRNSNSHGLNMLSNILNNLFNTHITAETEKIDEDLFFKLKIPLKSITDE